MGNSNFIFIQDMSDEELEELLSAVVNRKLEKTKEEVEVPRHYYEFTGTWSWGTWAPNKEDAVEQFKDACTEDFEILAGEYKVEEYE